MKVCIIPTWSKPDKADGGIRRVSEAQWKYLAEFGIEPTQGTNDADLIATHGTAKVNISDRPVVNHNHGLYWSKHQWPAWAHEANRQVVAAMVQAVAHTAPSRWVANALRRGMLVYPEIIHHGVDAGVWFPPPEKGHNNYILWNKARADPVSNPNDMNELAQIMPDIQFMSTIGKAANNVMLIGTMPVDQMFDWVQHAGLYLCTARETFGIGTLEAMACGVPVVGWDWGGQSEIIKQEETGFLANPGDYRGLADGIRWAFDQRDTLGANARQDVLDRWGWPQRIEQYAELYLRTKSWWDATECKVSILVTCHNLAKYLDDCLRSVAEQDFDDWECIIVDDLSDDDTPQVSRQWTEIDERFKYFRTPQNLRLSGARNFGFKQCKGKYILPLDADDMLADHALITLSHALDSDPNIHIAYGHLDTIREDGSGQIRSKDWPFDAFSWHGQMAHLNQLPYSSMMRREVMERTGGYRTRNWRAEDAELWIRATSFGFRAAKVTQASTLIYRWRGDSKTAGEESDGDWTAWYPWRLGAQTGKQGMRIFRGLTGASHPRPDLVPWGTQGFPLKDFWPVPDHEKPLISVVIPVGPKHAGYIIDALDSIMAQTYTNWETIVVNATGEKWPNGFESPVAGAPWARVIDAGKQLSPAQARNLGGKYAKGNAILWLDADDILLPHVMEEMLEIHVGTEGGLVYTDWLRGDGSPEKPLTLYESKEFKCGEVIRQMQHAMMCLVPRWAHVKIKGFDETLPGWEDWDYLIALQEAGVCSYRLEKPGFVYRFTTGSIREESFGKHKEIIPILRKKWGDYAEGKKHMPCSGCPGKRRVRITPETAEQKKQKAADPEAMVMLEYQGKQEGRVHIRGQATGTYYKFRKNEQKYVYASDAEYMLAITRKGTPDFVRVAQPTELPTAEPEIFVQTEVVMAEKPPEFPKMEEPIKILAMPATVAQMKEMLPIANDRTILAWLKEERKGKKRKTAIKMLEDEMNKRAK
jgi:glycosyltransferase involved in cell wall biosynthesis